MFFRLKANLNMNAGYIVKKANSDTLIEGVAVQTEGLVIPWPFTLKHDAPDGDPLLLSDFYPSKNLMSDRLVNTLKSAGIDNLQIFDSEIKNVKTGDKIAGYKVVNIIGLVAAADLAASKAQPLAHVQHFEKLVLDESRAQGHLIFRLAESLIDIIIAETVAKRIAAGNFVDVVVEPLG